MVIIMNTKEIFSAVFVNAKSKAVKWLEIQLNLH